MIYSNVCIEAFDSTLPDEIVTTAELERRLEPLYTRLKLPEGRLELLTGIRERRIWPVGVTPGTQSVKTVQKLFDRTGFDKSRIGALIHASVCRDYLEPATACDVHYHAGLPKNCAVFDVSNACLGLLSGMIQIANMIELGQIEAGVVVGTESSRSVMQATIQHLNNDMTLDRKSVKTAFASLTLGSGSAAVLLTSRKISRTGWRLLGGSMLAQTEFCHLCRSVNDQAGGDTMTPLMQTDSETLMHEGIRAAVANFETFLSEVGWTRESITKTFCHQVGRVHQQLMFEALQLSPTLNYSTLEFLGNTGSVALPIAAALGIETGFAKQGDRAALLGIGSGINVLMLGVQL